MTTATPTPPANVPPTTYRGVIAITSLLAALGAIFALVLVMGRELSRVASELSQSPMSAPANSQTLAIAIGTPALCAVLAALATLRVIWMIRYTRYTRTLRDYCRARLRRDAPLSAIGLALQGRLIDQKSQAPAEPRPIARLLSAANDLFLLGATGSGKSTALIAHAQSTSARSPLTRLLIGVRGESLPVLVSLPGLARTLEDATPSALPYLVALLARMGTEGLGARTERLLRAGRLLLLCDDYDRLDDDDRERVNRALAAISSSRYRKSRMVVTCETGAFQAIEEDLGPLAAFARIEIAPIAIADLSVALKKRWAPAKPVAGLKRSRVTAGPAPTSLAQELQARPLSISLGTAAIAAALTETLTANPSLAWSRAELLREQIQTASANAYVRDVEDSDPTREAGGDDAEPALVWTALAASLQEARTSFAPIDPSRTLGENVLDWFTQHAPPGPTDFALSERPQFLLTRIERDVQVGLRTGVLKRGLDGLTLGFAHTLAQAAAAGWWFDLTDDGLGRLNSQLLRTQWALPVALWAGAQEKPTDLAQRIFRFANSPDSIAPRAGLADSQNVYPTALALSLASVLEGVGPQLARIIAAHDTQDPVFTILQQGLRDLLDTCAIYGAQPAQRMRLTRALDRVQQEVGVEFVAYLGWLSREAGLDRMLRAQVTLALGMTATPEAVEQLIPLLLHTDPIMRQAVEQALSYAGERAIPAMQMATHSGSAPLRRRAEESLRLLGARAPGLADGLTVAAQVGLNSADAAQRRAAVATLSAIGASEALNDVIARLDDTSEDVRLAAATALGQLGGKRALLALRRKASSGDPNLRLAIAQALGQDPSPGSTPALLKLLADKDARVRAAAATSLGYVTDKRALNPLRQASNDGDPWVRHAAQTAVRRFTRG